MSLGPDNSVSFDVGALVHFYTIYVKFEGQDHKSKLTVAERKSLLKSLVNIEIVNGVNLKNMQKQTLIHIAFSVHKNVCYCIRNVSFCKTNKTDSL